MPESAEVKIFRDEIASNILLNEGKKSFFLVSTKIIGGKYLRFPIKNWDEFNNSLPLKVKDIDTRGKVCFINFDKGFSLTLQFGMSATINFTDEQFTKKTDPHDHIVLTFSTSSGKKVKTMIWNDYRRFGIWSVYTTPESLNEKLSSLGLDIFTVDLTNTNQKKEILDKFHKKKRQNICRVLMDQKAIMSGIGNYMKTEALYKCKVYPLAKVEFLDDKTLICLIKECQKIAIKAYECKGNSFKSFVANKKCGSYQNLLKIYKKETDPKGNEVVELSTPDGRLTSYVEEVQILGKP